jgi:hypothetical protein
MCNGAMLTGLDWISDGEKVITDRHGVAVGMYKMVKCPYHKQSECPFRLRVLQTSPSPPPPNPPLKKPRRPEATLILSTPLHTADPLVPLVPSTSYTKTMQQQQVVVVYYKSKARATESI